MGGPLLRARGRHRPRVTNSCPPTAAGERGCCGSRCTVAGVARKPRADAARSVEPRDAHAAAEPRDLWPCAHMRRPLPRHRCVVFDGGRGDGQERRGRFDRSRVLDARHRQGPPSTSHPKPPPRKPPATPSPHLASHQPPQPPTSQATSHPNPPPLTRRTLPYLTTHTSPP